jgi:hypothetical protein
VVVACKVTSSKTLSAMVYVLMNKFIQEDFVHLTPGNNFKVWRLAIQNWEFDSKMILRIKTFHLRKGFQITVYQSINFSGPIIGKPIFIILLIWIACGST